MKYVFNKIIKSKSIYIITLINTLMIIFLIFGVIWSRTNNDLDVPKSDYWITDRLMIVSSHEAIITVIMIGLSAAFLGSILLSDEVDTQMTITLIIKKGGRKKYYFRRWLAGIIFMQIFILYMFILRYVGSAIFLKNEEVRNRAYLMHLWMLLVYEIIGLFFISLSLWIASFSRTRVTIGSVLLLIFMFPIMSYSLRGMYKGKYESLSNGRPLIDKDNLPENQNFNEKYYLNNTIQPVNLFYEDEESSANQKDYISPWKFLNPGLYLNSLFTLNFNSSGSYFNRELSIERNKGGIGNILYKQWVDEKIGNYQDVYNYKLLNTYWAINKNISDYISSVDKLIDFKDEDFIKINKLNIDYFEKNPNKEAYFTADIYDANKNVIDGINSNYKDRIWKAFIENVDDKEKCKWWLNYIIGRSMKIEVTGINWKDSSSFETAKINIEDSDTFKDAGTTQPFPIVSFEERPITAGNHVINLKKAVENLTLIGKTFLYPTEENFKYSPRFGSKWDYDYGFWVDRTIWKLWNDRVKYHDVVKSVWVPSHNQFEWNYKLVSHYVEKGNKIDLDKNGYLSKEEMIKAFTENGLTKVSLEPFIRLWVSIMLFILFSIIFTGLYFYGNLRRNIR